MTRATCGVKKVGRWMFIWWGWRDRTSWFHRWRYMPVGHYETRDVDGWTFGVFEIRRMAK